MSSYDAADLSLGISSKDYDNKFRYRLNLGGRYASEKLTDADQFASVELHLDGGLGFVLENGHALLIDLTGDMFSGEGTVTYEGFDYDVIPHYQMSWERLSVDLGVRLSRAAANNVFTNETKSKGYYVYPNVKLEYKLVPDAMKLYFAVGGDDRLTKYSDLMDFNPRVNQFYGREKWNLISSTTEYINSKLCFEGRIGYRFCYNLRGGYVSYKDAPLEGRYDGLPAIGYASYDKTFAALDWGLGVEGFDFDGSVEYTYVLKNEQLDGLFLPAALKGYVSMEYNWKKRIVAGVDCLFSSARTSDSSVIPAYADLGVNAEYALNRKFSVWARGGNLLGMTIQRNVMYAEKGPYFSLGICLNL